MLRLGEGSLLLRYPLFGCLMMASLACLQGCATQDRAARAAEEAAVADSEDDATCQKRGVPGTEPYDTCREQRAEARAQAAAVQERKRRDFDRVLGAGTDAQTNF